MENVFKYPSDVDLSVGLKGIYSLTHGRAPNKSALEAPYVTGVSVRTYWKEIELEEGTFNWTLFDTTIKMAKRAKKPVILRVIAGAGTPDWAHNAGTVSYERMGEGKFGGRIPLPWDDVFLTKYENFVHAFGKRYDNELAVSAIEISPAAGGLWAEIHLPKVLLNRRDFSHAKLVEAHKRVFDFFTDSFPNKPVSFAVTGSGDKRQLDNDLTEYIISKWEKWSKRFYIQANGLDARGVMGAPNSETERSYNFLWEKPIRRGFQMIGAISWLPRGPCRTPEICNYRGSLAVTLGKGGTYIEIYQEDVINPSLRKDMEYVAEQLSKYACSHASHGS